MSIAILDQLVAQLSGRINTLDSEGKPMTRCMGVQAADRVRNAKLLVRGEIVLHEFFGDEKTNAVIAPIEITK